MLNFEFAHLFGRKMFPCVLWAASEVHGPKVEEYFQQRSMVRHSAPGRMRLDASSGEQQDAQREIRESHQANIDPVSWGKLF